MDAFGAINAILPTSSGFNSLSSTFTMSFLPIFLLCTFIATLKTASVLAVIDNIFNTFSACPAVIWSITVPFVIGTTFNSFFI